MVNTVKCFFEINCWHPEALLPFVCFLFQNCDYVKVIGCAVVVPEACLVWALVPVEKWFQTVVKQACEEFVEEWIIAIAR